MVSSPYLYLVRKTPRIVVLQQVDHAVDFLKQQYIIVPFRKRGLYRVPALQGERGAHALTIIRADNPLG